MSKKTNPNKRPVTMADVKRAKEEAKLEAIEYVWALFFTVMRDKENYSLEDLQRVWSEVEDLIDSIDRKYCKLQDLKHILKSEEGIVLSGE